MEQIAQHHAGADRVVNWMLREGRHITHMREFGDEMCRRIVAAGIPICRGFCSVATLHPQVGATAYIWRRNAPGAVRMTASHSFTQTQEFTSSPIAEIKRSGRAIRRKLSDPECPMDYPALADFRTEGCTDYLGLPMLCSSGEINTITFLTDRPDGFSDSEVEGLSAVAEALAIIVELQSTRRIARHLLDAYVGHRTGARVLSGAITRGSRESIHAIVWYCDLRDFTRLADTQPRDRVLDLLNEYFETMVNAVTAEGGEALKFIGDAMLAIFELGQESPSGRCEAALRAARGARAKINEQNVLRRGVQHPEIRFGLALHLGEVTYGNIGSEARLDFTVVGPAVNHASRIEKLAGELRRDVVTSASFAAACGTPLESLGLHYLKGISDPQEVFALPLTGEVHA